MYLWRSRELAAELRAGAVSEKEKFFYLLIWLSFFAVVNVLNLVTAINEAEELLPAISGGVAYFVITLVGTVVCYRSNRRGNDRAFLDRYICLSVPIWLQLFVVTVLLGLALGFLAESIELDLTWAGQALDAGILTIFFLRLNRKIKLVSQGVDD